MSTQATAPAISETTFVVSEKINRLKGFLGTADEMTSVAETLAPHSVVWVKSLSDDELFPLGERALQDIADDILVLDEIRQRFRLKGSMRGYSGWKDFVEKNSRYTVRTIQRRLNEVNGVRPYVRSVESNKLVEPPATAVRHVPDQSKPSPKPMQHKTPAVDQIKELRSQFNYKNVRIERVGGSNLTDFQVWVSDTPAKDVTGHQRVTVEMSAAQLRTVKGTVNIGANSLSPAGVKKFLGSLGITSTDKRGIGGKR